VALAGSLAGNPPAGQIQWPWTDGVVAAVGCTADYPMWQDGSVVGRTLPSLIQPGWKQVVMMVREQQELNRSLSRLCSSKAITLHTCHQT